MPEHYTSVTNRCPACRENKHTHREVYLYARAYLCPIHRSTWDAADEREHRGGKCPHAPARCPRGCEGRSAAA